eukprot:m.467768 g.467768  ORF g.467768 m.467768 type:complete len:1046 (+) comp21642_c1_seq19:793-3930(+)
MPPSCRNAFVSAISFLPEGLWFSYNSQRFDGATRSATKWSVAGVLDISEEVVSKGVVACDNFRTKWGLNSNCCQLNNAQGELVWIHKMVYGKTVLSNGKTQSCRWLSIGMNCPSHTPKDQVNGRVNGVSSILPSLTTAQTLELAGAIQCVEGSSAAASSSLPTCAASSLTASTLPSQRQAAPAESSERTMMRQRSSRIPVADTRNEHRKRKLAESALGELYKSMNVDKENPSDVAKMFQLVHSVAGYSPLSVKSLTPDNAMELHFRCNLSYTSLKLLLQRVSAMDLGITVCKSEEVVKYREGLQGIPKVRKPSEAEATIVGQSARYTRMVDFITSMLDSDSVRKNLDWKRFDGQLVILFAIDHAWVTGIGKRGLEIGFASLGNLFKYRNSPRACGLLYLSGEKETHQTLQAAVRLILAGISELKRNGFKMRCLGAKCEFCKQMGITVPCTEHIVPVRIFAVCDHKATHEMMGVDSDQCYRCNHKFSNSTGTGDLFTMEYFGKVNDAYEASFNEFKSCEHNNIQYHGSEQYSSFMDAHPGHVGPCALYAIEEIDGVRWCFLHMVLNMVNKVLKSTFLAYASKLEAEHKDGVYRLIKAYKKIGMPTRAQTMKEKYEKAMKDAKLVTHATDSTTGKQPSSRIEKAVDLYFENGGKWKKAELVAELVDLAARRKDNVNGLRKRLQDKYTIPVLKDMLHKELQESVQSQLFPIAELMKRTRRSLLMSPNEQLASASSTAARPAAGKKLVMPTEMSKIIDTKDTLLGNECMLLLNGKYKAVARELSDSIITMEKSATDRVNRASTVLSAALEKHSKIVARLDTLRDLRSQPMPENMSREQFESDRHDIEQEILDIDGHELCIANKDVEDAESSLTEEVKNLEATMSGRDTIALDTELEEFCDIWKALADMILPLMSVEKLHSLDPNQYQQDTVSRFVTLFEAKFSYKGMYMHLFKSGHVAEDIKFMQKNFPTLSFTFFSAQKSEHGNKLVKLLMLHMYGIDSTQDSYAFIIVDQNTRCVYYIDTCVAIGVTTCSKCGSIGHNRNNMILHPV